MADVRSIETLSIDGGCLCFDFVNTVNARREYEYDYLCTYKDLLDWCRKAQAMPEGRIKKLRALARANESEASRSLAHMKVVREAIYDVFSAIREGSNAPKTALAQFNEAMSAAMKNLQFSVSNGRPEMHWSAHATLEEPLWYIMKSCFDMLMQEEPERMKACERCGWLFMDKSKNKTRRWCNMQVCGSHDKALRYYYRKKQK